MLVASRPWSVLDEEAACARSHHGWQPPGHALRRCTPAPRARAQGPQLAIVVPTRELGVQTAILARAPAS